MRVDFIKAIQPLLIEDSTSLFMTGDVGYNALEPLASFLGRRFINGGVAEQNMIGVAAGMALAGFRPWIYSIATFATYRCLEQIRNDICLHCLPVHIVGNGGGYTYGIAGSTHHALEDLAVLKSFPNIRLFFPLSNDQVAKAVRHIHAFQGPTYLRLGISPYNTDFPHLSENESTLTRHYTKGNKVTVIGVGHAVHIILKALTQFDLKGLDLDVFGIARFPFDLSSDTVLKASVEKTRRVLVVEEHYTTGGMGESLKLALPSTDIFDIMAPHYFLGQRYGSAAFHLKQCGVTPENLVERLQCRFC